MVNIIKNNTSDIIILKSSFGFTTGTTYSLSLKNDLEQSIQYTDMIITASSSQYVSFKLTDIGSSYGLTGPSASLGEISIKNAGFYHLSILNDGTIEYVERAQVELTEENRYQVVNLPREFTSYDNYGPTFSTIKY